MRTHYVFTFSRCVFYSVSGGIAHSGRGYAVSRSHGPGLSSCAWKQVVSTWACGVGPARQTLCGRWRDRGASARGGVQLAITCIFSWYIQSFFTRARFDSVKITVLVTVRYRSDSISITVFITVSLPFYRATQAERRLF